MYGREPTCTGGTIAGQHHNTAEVAMAEDFTSHDFQRCLQRMGAASHLSIPPTVYGEVRAEDLGEFCAWILNRDEYLAWIDGSNSRALRLAGSPGSGKTTMSQFMVEEIKQKMRKSPGTSLACFFKDGRDCLEDTPAAILRSLMCQLLLQNRGLYRHIRSDFEETGEEQFVENHLNDFSVLWRDFRDMIRDENTGQAFVMLDGLDWCQEPLRLDLLRSFKDLLNCASMKRGAKLKLLVTYTRNNTYIDDELSDVGPALDMDENIFDAGFVNSSNNMSETFVENGSHHSCLMASETGTAEKTRYLAMLELLLSRGVHVTSQDNWCGQSPLSAGAQNGQESMVKLLIDNGVDIECRDKIGQTPLSSAAENGHGAVVKMLVDAGAEVDTKDKNGYTPLLLAAGNGHLPMVRFLLKNDANIHSGQTPVLRAVENGHLAVTELLLCNGAAADSADDTYRRTPLSRAAQHGYEAICELLCERGVEIDSMDSHQQTPLLWAAKNGHQGVVGRLLQHGAFIDARDGRYGQTSLTWACRSGHKNMVELLLGNRPELDTKDKGGRTALSWAAGNGECAMVKLLLEHGADVDRRDQNGRNPLSWASGNGHADTVRQLLDYNADSRSVDRYGLSPFSWASENAYGQIAKMLR